MPPKPSAAAPSPHATQDVKTVVSSLAESWNRHAMPSFAAAFAENTDFVNVIGMHWQGRQEIEAKHAVTHRTIFRSSNIANPRTVGAIPETDIVPVPFPVG